MSLWPPVWAVLMICTRAAKQSGHMVRDVMWERHERYGVEIMW